MAKKRWREKDSKERVARNFLLYTRKERTGLRDNDSKEWNDFHIRG